MFFFFFFFSSWYISGLEEFNALIFSSSDKNGIRLKNEDGSNFEFNLSNDGDIEYRGIVDIIPRLNVIKNKYMKIKEETNDESEKEEEYNIMNMLINEKFKAIK